LPFDGENDNFTVDNSCLGSTVLQLRSSGIQDNSDVNTSCWDGAAWVNLGQNSGGGATYLYNEINLEYTTETSIVRTLAAEEYSVSVSQGIKLLNSSINDTTVEVDYNYYADSEAVSQLQESKSALNEISGNLSTVVLIFVSLTIIGAVMFIAKLKK